MPVTEVSVFLLSISITWQSYTAACRRSHQPTYPIVFGQATVYDAVLCTLILDRLAKTYARGEFTIYSLLFSTTVLLRILLAGISYARVRQYEREEMELVDRLFNSTLANADTFPLPVHVGHVNDDDSGDDSDDYEMDPAIFQLITPEYVSVSVPPTESLHESVQKDASAETEESTDYEECVICKENMSVGDVVLKLPCSDRHVFHRTCIEPWMCKHATCPLCKKRAVLRVARNDEGTIVRATLVRALVGL